MLRPSVDKGSEIVTMVGMQSGPIFLNKNVTVFIVSLKLTKFPVENRFPCVEIELRLPGRITNNPIKFFILSVWLRPEGAGLHER